MFKITNKTTKAEALAVLAANTALVSSLLDKNLAQSLEARMTYTFQHEEEAKRRDVLNLLRDVMKAVGSNLVIPTAADEAQAETTSQETSGDTAEKKPEGKKKTKKSGAPIPRGVVMASVFPDTIVIDGQTFTVDHEVKTLKDLSEDKEYEFAFYWAPVHLRQFPYVWHKSPENPKAFPQDLDTAQLIYVSDEGVVAYCVSDYTEAAYTVYARDLEEFEGLRYCNGIEFQIYSRPSDEATPESEPETEAEAAPETTEEPKA